MFFNESDGLRYVLEQRYTNNKNDFPSDNIDYISLYKQIEDHLNKNVHPETEKGAMLHGKDFLTDHGVEHIKMVIQRAGLLLGDKVNDLSGFEIFILLLSAHLHDVGNIYGRDKHEEKIVEVVRNLDIFNRIQTPVIATVVGIATAHGGTYNNSKDTIVSLLPSDYVEGIKIRPTVLASILRYADELADDHTRAARFLYDAKIIPTKNNLFHDYSKTLEPVAIAGDTAIYKFNIPIDLVVGASVPEKDSETKIDQYLYDEILSRLCKSIRELDYCKKYSQGFIFLNAVNAKISVYEKTAYKPLYSDSIRLRLSGYPDPSNFTIENLCENQLVKKTGKELKEHILALKEIIID